jgi:hypothetical protein
MRHELLLEKKKPRGDSIGVAQSPKKPSNGARVIIACPGCIWKNPRDDFTQFRRNTETIPNMAFQPAILR